ncbi:hypothetical protein PMI14_06787 [Acidovorax sp. CF316]|uniref:hypothetical protein n=1 Tax=Acidovorax sp. CF316 TaxID=1144317 RepID=UPI00026BE2F4|nr:hypothetical protein [Acidovorax sp. CF316]EJE48786.1 hypothetical protein PMI14_06787 [Acidovorax sp. CF316]
MIGMKIRADEPVARPCLTYFVKEKIPLEELPPRARIPSRLVLSGTSIPTDVIVWPKMEMHDLSRGKFIRDGFTQGVLTAFAESRYGRWGLSCGHCMLGPDQKPYTHADIEMHDHASGNFVSAGPTAQTYFSPGGSLISGARGYIDCGLFALVDEKLRARAETALPLDTVDLASTAYQRLTGESVMAIGEVIGGKRSGLVIGIDQFGIDDYSDIVLKVDLPGLIVGDSGMLWLTSDGRAAAIHCRGEIVKRGNGSILVTAMSAQRASEVLGVTLLMEK